ncbi:MAG: FtsX-like permease family protein [Bifidobacterium sp.]|uniref:FtsX-like permease family protein n=2 Tax=Bifidobacterium fermentum TaxID=3059035 RepID=A0AB39UE00_9BIFI
MWSVTIQLMKRNLTMLIPAAIAILVGSMFVSCTFLFSNTLDYSLRKQVSANFGDANYGVTQTDSSDDSSSDMTTFADYHLDWIRKMAGVEGARTDVSTRLEISANAGDSGSDHSSSIAIAAARPTSIMPLKLSSGTWPKASGQIAIADSVAKQLKLSVGSTVNASTSAQNSWYGTSGSISDMKVVGITNDDAGAFTYYRGACVMSEADIAKVQGVGSGFDGLYASELFLKIAPVASASEAQTIASVKDMLPQGFTMQSRQRLEDQQIKQMGGGQFNIITTFVLVFGILAMFVAGLVIGNTFQVMVAQRRRTLALLRTIGARKGQLYRSVILEAIVLGTVGSVLGVACALALMAVLGVAGTTLGGLSFALIPSWQVFVIPVVFALLATIVASLSSARMATKVTPLEALQPMENVETKRSGKLRVIFASLMLLAGIALCVLSIRGTYVQTHTTDSHDISQEGYVLVAIMGAILCFISMLMTSRLWIPAMLKAVGAVISHIGASSTLASANIQKNRRRVAATGSALLIGVTLVSCLGIGAASAKQTMATVLDSHYSVDIQAVGQSLDSSALRKVEKVQGVGQAEMVQSATATIASGKYRGDSIDIYGVDAHTVAKVMHGTVDPQDLEGGRLVLSQSSSSEDSGLEKEGKIEIAGAESNVTSLPVTAGAYRGLDSTHALYGIVSKTTFDSLKLSGTSDQIWLKSDGSASTADLVSNVSAALGSYASVNVVGSIAERATWEKMVNATLMILVALLAVAVIIALIGVTNTLSLSVIERQRESATLRAIGMTKSQLRRSLAIEAILISLSSGISGIVAGTAFGWLGSYVVFSAFGTVSLPFDWKMACMIILVALIAALLSSIIPARRAIKVSPVAALAEA